VIHENEFSAIKVYRNDVGELHREDGPALIHGSGSEEWFLNGQRHREDGPAIIRANGRLKWFKHGKRHRIGGPAHVWYVNGEIYEEEWWIDGVRHRDDGPAMIIRSNIKVWFLNGNRISQKLIDEFLQKFELELPLNPDEVVLFNLYFK